MSGASRKNERWEHTEGETMAVEGKSEAEKLVSDPMYRLEHDVEDKKKSSEAAPRVAKILVSLSYLFILCTSQSINNTVISDISRLFLLNHFY